METNKNIYTVALLTLLIGLTVGFYAGRSRENIVTNSHLMPDGTLMSNDGHDMASMMADMNKALLGKTGDDFDKAFLEEMIVHHQGAVEMAKLALTNAKHKEVIDLSNAIISAQNKEIADMNSWLDSWYK